VKQNETTFKLVFLSVILSFVIDVQTITKC